MYPVRDTPHHEAAWLLRRQVARVHSLAKPERIIFGCGVMACLRHLFLLRQHTHFALTSIEYYGPEHFPGRRVDVFEPDGLVEGVVEARPQVVIASLAGWAGGRFPLADWFAAIRKQFGPASPLLVADCCHAGAVGFPGLAQIGADLVCGDLAKWVAPTGADKVAFVWPATRALFEELSPLFAGYYLSVEGQDTANAGSFVSPSTISTLSELYQSVEASPEQLAARFRTNLLLARSLSGDTSIESCNVCLPATSPVLHTPVLREAALTRDRGDGRVRVMCRADCWPLSLARFLPSTCV